MTNPDLVSIPSGVTPTLYLLDLTIPGAGTALLGKEGAMACTVAVEESIAHHYNNQIRTLMEKEPEKYEELLQVSDHALKGLPGVGGRADMQFDKRTKMECWGLALPWKPRAAPHWKGMQTEPAVGHVTCSGGAGAETLVS